MAEGIKTPPKFDGLNFPIWKVKMTVFLQFLGSRVVKAVTKPFSAPTGDEDTVGCPKVTGGQAIEKQSFKL